MIQGSSLTGASGDGIRYGVLQFGDKVYQELPLGAAPNLKEFIPKILNIKFRNDSYNNVAAAIEAATEMLETRYVCYYCCCYY